MATTTKKGAKKSKPTTKPRRTAPKKSQAKLAQTLQSLRRDLTEALEQQTATSDVLRVISSSPTDVQPVFDAIVRSATRLCEASFGSAHRFDGKNITIDAYENYTPEQIELGQRRFPTPATRATAVGRAILGRDVIHIEDVRDDPEYEVLGNQSELSFRTVVAVPLLKDGSPIGALGMWRREVKPFTENQINLVKTFADQAVIAIENVRLFRELTEALEQQTATSEILGVIASSPTNIQPVLDTIAKNAARVCGSYDALIRLVEGNRLQLAAHYGPVEPGFGHDQPLTRGSVSGRAVSDRKLIHVEDLMAVVATEFPEAVGANANGETLARAGQLFQALEEYEKALGAHPGYVPARSNYSAAVRALSSRDLTKDFQAEAVRDRRRVTARLVDRLATSGLTAEIGRATTQAQDDDLLVLSVPVTLSVDPAALEAVSEMVTRMGGTVERRTAPAPRLLLGFTQVPAIGREVTRQLAVPRRAFVRLLRADGRTIAVSSVLREWQLNRWVTPSDEIHLFVETGHRVEVTARVGGLTEEQVSQIARAEVTVEPVLQERAIVRVEYEEEAPLAGARETLLYRPGNKSEPTAPREAAPEDRRRKPGELLQKIVSDLWNPPITILGVGSRVLPGNVRAGIIGFTIEENGEVVTPPRLVKGSGESLYDAVAMETAASAIPRWLDARNTGGPVAGAPPFSDRPGRVRIHFQLVKDAPSVNVIARRSVAARSRPRASRLGT